MYESRNFRTLSKADRRCTVFHIWVNFCDGANPIRTKAEVQWFYKRLVDYLEKYGCYLITGAVMDDHIHVIIYSPSGPEAISNAWRCMNVALTKKARRKGIKGDILVDGVQYSAIRDPRVLFKTIRYILENGLKDGHFVIGTLEHEHRFKDYEFSNIMALRYISGCEPDDVKAIVFCPEQEFYAKLRNYEGIFRKKKRLYEISDKNQDFDTIPS